MTIVNGGVIIVVASLPWERRGNLLAMSTLSLPCSIVPPRIGDEKWNHEITPERAWEGGSCGDRLDSSSAGVETA